MKTLAIVEKKNILLLCLQKNAGKKIVRIIINFIIIVLCLYLYTVDEREW